MRTLIGLCFGCLCVGLAGAALGDDVAPSADNQPFHARGTTKVYLLGKSAGTIAPGVTDVPFSAAGRTLEWVDFGSQMSVIAPGSNLVSLAFRNATTGAWPLTNVQFTDFTVKVSRSAGVPGAMSATIADNNAGDEVVARTGALTLPAGAIAPRPSAGSRAPFSFDVGFSNGYAYAGGHTRFLLSHSSSLSGGMNLEGVAPGDGDFGSLVQARVSAGEGATETTQNSPAPTARVGVDAAVSLPLVAATTSNGTGSFTGCFGQSAFSGQFIIAADQLGAIPAGSLITSLNLRLAPGEDAWPGAQTTTENFQIELASASRGPGLMLETFNDNVGGGALRVRDGALTLNPGTFPAGSSGMYGAAIAFQRGFVYAGGDLCVTIRHAPFTVSGPAFDRANPPTAIRTVTAPDDAAFGGTLMSGDAGLAIRLGYTPSICFPNIYATASGGDGAFLFDTPRVHQIVCNASEMAGIPVGSAISGMAFRISPVGGLTYVTWPAATVSVSQFDVTLSTAQTTAATMSGTFNLNEGLDRVLVRSGPLTIPALSMKVVGASVAEQTFVVEFPTPFIYAGGGLCITMRNGQMSGVSPVNFDGKFNNTTVHAKRATGSSTATFGNNAAALSTRLVFVPPVETCPADLNHDNLVDDNDFVLFVVAYDTLVTPAGDFNFDGVTDDADFSVFVVGYDTLLCS